MLQSNTVEIIEVGPRDGLQRESTPISTEEKVELIQALVDAGLSQIQVTSFVHPKYVPQMADAEAVCAQLKVRPDVVYSGLALNLRGVERARDAGLNQVDISVSANEAHSRRNANRSIDEALAEFRKMYDLARAAGMTIRGGIQCAFGYRDPDDVELETVRKLARHHLELGIDKLALADSAGFANPRTIESMLSAIMPLTQETPLVLHLHDTRGLGLANVTEALRHGVRRFDTAFGGLGGCPFIDGAAGNIATEDTVYLLEQLGYTANIDLTRLSAISKNFEVRLGRALPGKIYSLAS